MRVKSRREKPRRRKSRSSRMVAVIYAPPQSRRGRLKVQPSGLSLESCLIRLKTPFCHCGPCNIANDNLEMLRLQAGICGVPAKTWVALPIKNMGTGLRQGLVDPCDPWKCYNDGVSQPMGFGGLNGRYDLSSIHRHPKQASS